MMMKCIHLAQNKYNDELCYYGVEQNNDLLDGYGSE
jgi:hypothetical protein